MTETNNQQFFSTSMEKGATNSITDVEGVLVGHETISQGSTQTGVTAILPHGGNMFRQKVTAASHVINGFGKTSGLVQLDELGVLETPILLSNTLAVGTCFNALVDHALEQNEEIGRDTGTVNPVIGECNDMFINDIRKRSVRTEHARSAILSAGKTFEEGSVGAGRGMMCYSLKGGIGSSSRLVKVNDHTYSLGVLVLTNFGLMKDLRVGGNPIGAYWSEQIRPALHEDKGSVMIITATDLPVSHRQLQRVLKRAVTGLARTGSVISNGSGDIVIGFSTAEGDPSLQESCLDDAFRAIGEATEESVIRSLQKATPVTGREDFRPATWTEMMEEFPYF
ncbi:P1 family peptidase [Salimicrobium flavidum]|uniref:D-aminopeptidase n=1 Tax=Salimicrobium flavidum TaxID=570947 RepID=A0A1N7JJ73_9BACI|nr:P1 family peptidase [Salimicrobium flavidum]SIS49304.1 D-aminopeptidase [Salimicrobium flavidum]